MYVSHKPIVDLPFVSAMFGQTPVGTAPGLSLPDAGCKCRSVFARNAMGLGEKASPRYALLPFRCSQQLAH